MSTIKAKILLCQAATVILTVVLLGTLSYHLLVVALIDVQKKELMHLARSTSRELALSLNDFARLLQRIESDQYHQRFGDLPLAKLLAGFQETFPVLAYLKPNGQEEVRMVRKKIAFDRIDWSESEIFRQAVSRPNRTVFSSAGYSPDLGETVVWAAIAHKSYFGDEMVGVLIGAIPLHFFQQWLQEIAMEPPGFLSIVDRFGTVLAHPHARNFLVPLAISRSDLPDFQRRLFTLESGFSRATLQGLDGFVAFSPVDQVDWQVLASIPYDSFMVTPNRMKAVTLAVCLVMLTGGLAISYVFARRLTRNIDAMIDHTRSVSAGDLSRRLSIASGDEIEKLAHAFNAMSQRLDRTQKSRENLNRILQSISDPLFVTDGAGRISSANEAAVSLLRCKRSDIFGRPLPGLFADDDLGTEGTLRAQLEEGPIRNRETQLIAGGGRPVPVLFSCSLSASENDQRPGMVCILKDISDRKRTEEALSQALIDASAAQEKINAILKAVMDGLLVLDPRGRIILTNPASEKLLGVHWENCLGRPVFEVVRNPAVKSFLQQALVSPQSERADDLGIQSDPKGPLQVLEARATAVRNSEGEITSILVLLHDVTQDRQIERLKSEFISTAAHELRTPLTSIIGFSELLLEPEMFGEFSADQKKEFLQEIHNKAESLARIIHELLDIGRIESGQPLPLEFSACDLGPIVAKTVQQFGMQAPRHRFETDLAPGGLGTCVVDCNKITQVLENLLSNAVKYSPDGGRIRVRGARSGEKVALKVEDEGIGMTAEQVAHIFDKFYRANATNTAIGGLGLGMSIVKQIVDAHQGRIWVESTPGRGTRITVEIPTTLMQPADQRVDLMESAR